MHTCREVRGTAVPIGKVVHTAVCILVQYCIHSCMYTCVYPYTESTCRENLQNLQNQIGPPITRSGPPQNYGGN